MRIGRYRHTHRPYVGMDMLATQIAERRAELGFLRSTWPRGLTQPTGVATELALPTAAILADSPSPDVAVTAADGATDDAMAAGPATGTVGVAPALPHGEHIASVSDGRPARIRSVQITSVPDGRPLSSAGAPPRGAGPAPAAAPRRGIGAGGSSTPHFPMMPPLAAEDATVPTASASATLAASSSLGATVGTAAGATATAVSAAGVGIEVGTDRVPATTAPPTTEHISSFLSCIRRRAADDATATAATAAETLATPPPSDVSLGANEGATANAAFAAAASLGSADISVLSPPAADGATSPTDIRRRAADDATATAAFAAETLPTLPPA